VFAAGAHGACCPGHASTERAHPSSRTSVHPPAHQCTPAPAHPHISTPAHLYTHTTYTGATCTRTPAYPHAGTFAHPRTPRTLASLAPVPKFSAWVSLRRMAGRSPADTVRVFLDGWSPPSSASPAPPGAAPPAPPTAGDLGGGMLLPNRVPLRSASLSMVGRNRFFCCSCCCTEHATAITHTNIRTQGQRHEERRGARDRERHGGLAAHPASTSRGARRSTRSARRLAHPELHHRTVGLLA
jgi:hypothetical protein